MKKYVTKITKIHRYEYLLLIISAILPILYVTGIVIENMFHKLLCITFFVISSYMVISGNYKFYVITILIGIIVSTYFNISFPIILSLWLLSLVFSRKPYTVILGAGISYIIVLKLKALGFENCLAPSGFVITDIGLNYLELSLILLGLVSTIAIAFTADVRYFEIGNLAQMLALIVTIEAALTVISWINVLTSVITIYGISIILFIRAIEKYYA